MFEKAYDGLKNITNLGLGSKKVEEKINLTQQGKITEKEAKQAIEKYEKSILPDGMTKDVACEAIENELKRIFFTPDIKLETMSIDNLLELTDSIQRKLNIIPDSTQLNLYKAKQSAKNSYMDLFASFFNSKFADADTDSKASEIKTRVTALANMLAIKKRKKRIERLQEKLNLFNMSLNEAWKFFKNPTNQKTNSKEHLIYQFKQDMNKVDIKKMLEEMFSG